MPMSTREGEATGFSAFLPAGVLPLAVLLLAMNGSFGIGPHGPDGAVTILNPSALRSTSHLFYGSDTRRPAPGPGCRPARHRRGAQPRPRPPARAVVALARPPGRRGGARPLR